MNTVDKLVGAAACRNEKWETGQFPCTQFAGFAFPVSHSFFGALPWKGRREAFEDRL